MVETDVIVIGGGLAGLSCAVALCDRGLRVTVLEAGDAAGGRARSWTDAHSGDRIDIGPHILLSEYRNLLALLDRLGTRDRIVWQGRRFLTLVERPEPLVIRTHPLPAPLHLLPSLLKAPQASARDLLSNLGVFWRAMRLTDADVRALDRSDAESFLRGHGVSAHFIDWFWRSAAMTLMNVPLARCSAGALLQLFRYLIGVSGYQIGLAGIGLGDLFAPAAVKAIEAGGGRVRMRTPVAALLGDGPVTGVRLEDGSELHARWCVAALPPRELHGLLPPALRERHAVFSTLPAFEPSPYVSTYLWFDRKLTHERFWSKTWSPGTLHYDFYDLSNIRPGWGPRASVIACNLIYSGRAAHLSDDEVIAAAVREVGEFAPGAADARVVHASVHRIPMAIPAPHPGTERLRPGAATPVERLLLAGDWLDTGLPCSMESAVRGGWLAAEQVLAAAGRPESIALPPPQAQGLVRWLGHRQLR
jgi:squalene-associated FAD-dependent desaturase